MADHNNIERKIKEGFESTQYKAPENLWSGINNSLDDNSNVLDDKVKSSFENKSENAPEGIWANIDKQLTIDRGWLKIYKLLQIQTFYKWTKRLAAFLILLVFVTFALKDTFNEKESVKLSENYNNFAQKVKHNAALQNNDRKIKIALSHNQINSNPASIITTSLIKSEIFDLNNYQKKEVNLLKSNSVNIGFDSGLDDVLSLLNPIGEAVSKKTINVDGYDNYTDSLIVSNSSVDSTDNLIANNEHLEKTYDENIEPKEIKFEFGLTTVLNTTAIVNNTIIRSFDDESLVVFNPSFGSTLGLQFVYHLNKKHSLVSNLTYSSINQSYSEFKKGGLYNEAIKFNYIRLQTLYQFNYKRFDIQRTSFIIKIGPYFGYKTKSNFIKNNEPQYEALDKIRNYDFGLTLQVGQSFELNKLVLDYGLNMDKGLINLNKGIHETPASFNRTTTAGLGAYLSIRYKI